jgi:hypothetical protein
VDVVRGAHDDNEPKERRCECVEANPEQVVATAKTAAETPRQRKRNEAAAAVEGNDRAVRTDAMEPAPADVWDFAPHRTTAPPQPMAVVAPSGSEVFEFPHIRDLKIFNPNMTPSGVAQPEQHRHHSKPRDTFCALAGLELVWTILLGRDDSSLSVYTATNLAYCVFWGVEV